MKIRILPIPAPWTADAAVLHIYKAWTNRGQVHLDQIHLSNPNMVSGLVSLCECQKEDMQEVPKGRLAGVGVWQLRRAPDGTATIVIEHHGPAMGTP